ncbi:hypothetical protein AGDE_09620 [Angomonas deanei]|nr:hypothetical protein AGDE_09620 [Angomonas deanei]|eukprot:EPY30085.1 hypothetical protein AGDE_09620 [Angomonas deanei]
MKRVIKNGQPGSRQSYQNKTKFNPNKYKGDKERLSPQVLQVMTSLCCARCCQILQWKVDYGKYVPQQKVRKCNRCGENSVNIAYHRICQNCCQREGRCAKCQKVPKPPVAGEGEPRNDEDEEREEESSDDNSEVADETNEEVGQLDEEGLPLSLQYLDTRHIDGLKAKKRREEEQLEIGRLKERERRTVIRKKQQERRAAAEGDDALSDDSDVVL